MVSTEAPVNVCNDPECGSTKHRDKAKCLPHLRQARRAYQRARRAERSAANPRRIPNSQRQCRLDDCTLTVWAKDLCRKHYKRYAIRPPCAFPGCTKNRHAQDMCSYHYEVLRKLGFLQVIQPQGVFTPQERFAQYVNVTETCHLWTGHQTDGRGAFSVSSEQTAPAHRVAFEFVRGPIPVDDDGNSLELDHGCRISLCTRVDHLEPVTSLENMRRQGVAHGQRGITQADGWLFGLAIPAWQRGADNFPPSVVKTA